VAKTDESYEVVKSDAEWRQLLTQEQYQVLRRHGTERAGTSPLDKRYDPGRYLCAGCGQALFGADTKFDSGSGWPRAPRSAIWKRRCWRTSSASCWRWVRASTSLDARSHWR